MTIPKLRGRTSTIGGGVAALDAIDGAKLNDGDLSVVFTSGARFLPYRLNATSGAAEANPAVITPDTNAGDKRHILMSSQFNLVYQNGLVFPGAQVASADVHTMDDYEENDSWLLGIAFGGAAVGVTYSARTGSYTKIGNRVFATGYITLSSKGSSTGAATITGLPFTAGGYAAVNMVLFGTTFADQYHAYIVSGTTAITLAEVTMAGVGTPLTDADFANTSSLIYTAEYRV